MAILTYASQGCASPQNTVCFYCTHCRAVHRLVSEPLANSPSCAKLCLTGQGAEDFDHRSECKDNEAIGDSTETSFEISF